MLFVGLYFCGGVNSVVAVVYLAFMCWFLFYVWLFGYGSVGYGCLIVCVRIDGYSYRLFVLVWGC